MHAWSKNEELKLFFHTVVQIKIRKIEDADILAAHLCKTRHKTEHGQKIIFFGLLTLNLLKIFLIGFGV